MSKTYKEYKYPSNDISQCPYGFYQSLREEKPVYNLPDTDIYLVSRHEESVEILKNPTDFSNKRPWEPPTHPEAIRILETKGWKQHHLLSGTDPPEHTRLRNVVKQAFTRKRIQQLEASVRRFSNEMVEGFSSKGKVEVISEYAEWLPLFVICEMLGVGSSDYDRIRHWSDSIVAMTAGNLTPEKEIAYTNDLVAFQHYLKAQIDDFRAKPTDSFLSDMIAARDSQGEGLDDPNLIDMARLLLAAGHETTMQLIGNAMLQLVSRPKERARLQADPTLIPKFVEEVLRYESPVTRAHRVATRDVDFHGVRIPKGARVLPMLGSANRDELAFSQPDEFDIDRSDITNQLAFGWGMHMCLGAPLARIEATVAIETFLSKLKNLRLVPGQNLTYRDLATRRGLRSLYLEWDA